MSKDLFSRYIWIVDTIRRYGRISREELNNRWCNSPYSNGEPMPRRTFYNHRQAIEELFNINIECDATTYEYYIEDHGAQRESVTNWLLNSVVTNNVLSDSREVAERVFLEDIPSARHHLGTVMDALKANKTVQFLYAPFTRSQAREVMLKPYFLKLFRQRWYVTGRNVKEKVIKTYALDRMTDAVVTSNSYHIPDEFDASEFCRDTFGVIFDQSEPRRVSIRTTPQQAKYLRNLPLHHSQEEMVHDDFSIFNYKIKLTRDFLQELLSLGPEVVVLDPPELRAQMVNALQNTISQYTSVVDD